MNFEENLIKCLSVFIFSIELFCFNPQKTPEGLLHFPLSFITILLTHFSVLISLILVSNLQFFMNYDDV